MKRLKDYGPPIIGTLAVLVIIGTAVTAALTPMTSVQAAPQQGWEAGYDQGHIEGACVALTGTVGCDWTTVTVCPDGGITPPCVIWQGNAVTLYLDHVCPWLPDDAVCVDVREH